MQTASPLEWISFERALSDTEDQRRHLLLGNGFSIQAYEGFKYKSLLTRASEVDETIRELLDALGARDFEHAMRLADDPQTRDRLRETFIKTITLTHPLPREISTASRLACSHFLTKFLRKTHDPRRGVIFTTNYDLILYWILVQHNAALDCWDGFDADYVWNGVTGGPHVFYLHGGMHIYERPLGTRTRIVKIEADKAKRGRRLRDVIRDHLDNGEFPVFISEGTSTQKRGQIRANDAAAFRKFGRACAEPDSTLFTVGHGLSEVDLHLTDVVGNGQVQRVYLGLFSSEDEQRANTLVTEWRQQRACRRHPPVEVKLFKTAECEIWLPKAELETLPPARRQMLTSRRVAS